MVSMGLLVVRCWLFVVQWGTRSVGLNFSCKVIRQSSQHSANLGADRLDFIWISSICVAEPFGNQDLCLQLGVASLSLFDELPEVASGTTSRSFRNIACNGHGGPPHLRTQAIDLLFWKSRREVVYERC
jgi:hypothetical protein